MIDETILNPSTWTDAFTTNWTEIITSANNGVEPANLSAALDNANTQLGELTDASGPQVVTLNNDGTATVTAVGE